MKITRDDPDAKLFHAATWQHAIKAAEPINPYNGPREVSGVMFALFYDDRPLTIDILKHLGFEANAWGNPLRIKMDYVVARLVTPDSLADASWIIMADCQHDDQRWQDVPYGLAPKTVGDLRWLCWRLNIELPV